MKILVQQIVKLSSYKINIIILLLNEFFYSVVN